MKRITQYFFITILFLLSPVVFSAETKKWQETQLFIVELNSDLKPVDKKEVTLEKPFNASNDIFKIDFSYLLDDKSLERKINIQSDNVNILQRFVNPDQALNWATQIKLNNGKTYYFIINKVEMKK